VAKNQGGVFPEKRVKTQSKTGRKMGKAADCPLKSPPPSDC
jgi:hypothetical protein